MSEQSEQELAPAASETTSQEKPRGHKHLHIREKIRASKILQRLEANALGELSPPMTATEIKSAEVVIRKVIPDLQAITLSGDPDNPLRSVQKVEIEVIG